MDITSPKHSPEYESWVLIHSYEDMASQPTAGHKKHSPEYEWVIHSFDMAPQPTAGLPNRLVLGAKKKFANSDPKFAKRWTSRPLIAPVGEDLIHMSETWANHHSPDSTVWVILTYSSPQGEWVIHSFDMVSQPTAGHKTCPTDPEPNPSVAGAIATRLAKTAACADAWSTASQLRPQIAQFTGLSLKTNNVSTLLSVPSYVGQSGYGL